MKLKRSNLDRLIEKLSGREIDLYLYLIQRQSNLGQVNGVNYKDAMINLNMPKSTFYKSLYELEEKEFIHINWGSSYGQFDIIILDNIFVSEKDYSKGYISINVDFILSLTFIKLHVNLKKFFLRLLNLQSMNKLVKVNNDLLKKYKVYYLFDELGKMFTIIPTEKGYLFSIKNKLSKKKVDNGYFLQYKHNLINFCKRYKISYTYKDLLSCVTTMLNYRKIFGKINKALDSIRKKYILQPKLITYICNL